MKNNEIRELTTEEITKKIEEYKEEKSQFEEKDTEMIMKTNDKTLT